MLSCKNSNGKIKMNLVTGILVKKLKHQSHQSTGLVLYLFYDKSLPICCCYVTIHLSFSLSDLNFCSWRTDESWAVSGMLRWRPHYHKFLSAVVSTCEDVLHAQVGTHYFGRPVCLKAQSCVSWIKRCQFWGRAGVFWPWSAAHGTESWLGLRKPRKGQGDISCWEVGPGKALSHLWNYLSGSYLQCLWDCTF